MTRMSGLSIESLKKNPALVPLFFCIAVGALGSSMYTLRLALRNPDVTWSQKRNPEPWQEYGDKQYKFHVHRPEVAQLKSPAPKY